MDNDVILCRAATASDLCARHFCCWRKSDGPTLGDNQRRVVAATEPSCPALSRFSEMSPGSY